MICAGIPCDTPTEFVALNDKITVESADKLAQIVRPRKPLIGNVTLKIDVSKMGISAIETLAGRIRKYLAVQFIGGDTIYATGEISIRHYDEIWGDIDLFDCKVIC